MDLNQVTVPSINLELSVSFYQKLGLKLIVDSIPRYARLECPDGTTTLSVHRVEALPQGRGVSLYFECDDLDEEVQRLKNEGIQFDRELEDTPWLWREAQLHDPDGNHLLLFKAGENRKDPPWKVRS